LNMLSSLTSSISRSSLNLNHHYNRQASNTSRSEDPVVPTPSKVSAPLPVFTTNIRQIQTAQPSSYWSGRFQALHDRFHNEILDACLLDPQIFQEYVAVMSPPKLSSSKQSSPTANTSLKLMVEDEDRRSKRVFVRLEALCATNEARKSLYDWQVQFARIMENEALLPHGATMTDKIPVNWVGRMGRAFSGGKTKGAESGNVGRKSVFGLKGEKRRTTVLPTVS